MPERRAGPAAERLALVMVGLPARGKTHLARRITRYLSWLGYRTELFNVGNYRRARIGSQMEAAFFDPSNEATRAARAQVAMAALEDMLAFFARGGDVGVYDATNNTRDRRDMVAKRLRAFGLRVVFIESVCEDDALIEANIRQVKLHMPDYEGSDPEEAVRDFKRRIAHYERAYTKVSEEEGAFIRTIDVGRRVELHKVQGYLPSRITTFLLNLHLEPRPLFLTRHGQSQFNAEGRIGGDSALTDAGQTYAENLAEEVRRRGLTARGLRVFTSTLQRTMQTATALELPFEEFRALDEIDAGDFDGLTRTQIRLEHTADHHARLDDKLAYRYPRGESYLDVIARLEPVIVEIERERRPLLVVAHQAVLRALYAYLVDQPMKEIPFLDVPLHTVIELTPIAYDYREARIELGPTV